MAEVLIEGYRLDVKEGLDFSFNYSIADVRDPNKRSTSYSKTIKCPSTKANDLLFGNIWDVNISNQYNSALSNINANFNPNKKAEARVVADGVEVMTGVVQLRQITVENTKLEYEVVFIGKLKNIFSELGDKELNGTDESGVVYIDFSNLDHGFNETNVVASWSNTSGYTYPMIDYGIAFDYNGADRIYDIDSFRPAVFLKDIVDKIFNFAGFTYTSNFFNSAPFTKLIVPWYKESFTLTDEQIADRQFTAATGTAQDILAASTTVIIQNEQFTYMRLEFDDLSDPSNLWNDTTYVYSPNAIGYYSLFTNINFTASAPVAGVLPALMLVKRLSNGVETIVDAIQFDIDLQPPNTTTVQWSTQQELCFVGDTLWVELWIDSLLFNIVVGLGGSVEMDTGSALFNQVAEQQIFEGADVPMNNFVPEVGMAELLLSIFKMFNLYVTVDPLDEQNLIIETRDEYYNGGTTRDWTHKIAKNRPIALKPLALLTAKEYIYTYEDDEDFYNKKYQDTKGYAYGRRRSEIDNDFLNNKTEVKIAFSPTPLVNDDVTSRIIPKIYDEDIESGAKPTDINIRVLYFNHGLQSNPTWSMRYNGGNSSTIYSIYPYAGHLDNPITPTLDLNFGIPNQLYYTANGYTGTLQYTNANLFNVYHRAYIDEITNKDSKVLTGEFYLTPWDITKLDFRDLIIVENAYWRINKVNDYNPFKDDLTKVELIKVLDIQRQPVETFVLGTQGTTSGEQRPTNKHEIKLNRSQFMAFGGSVDGSGNKVHPTVKSFKVIGDNNYIGAGSENVTILGSGNEVFNGASNVVIINSDNQKAVKDNTTIIDGVVASWRYVDATIAYDASDREFVLADATAGAFTVTLPAVADSTDVWINVKKVDVSVNAVTVSSKATGLIDGAATKVLSTQYDSVDFYCDGSNWFIRSSH